MFTNRIGDHHAWDSLYEDSGTCHGIGTTHLEHHHQALKVWLCNSTTSRHCVFFIQFHLRCDTAWHITQPACQWEKMTAPKQLPSLRTTRNVTTWLMLFLLCGNIHLNPGPPMYHLINPCGFCDLQVSWSNRAVCCDKCDIWYHKSCVSMLSRKYEEIEDVSWNCIKCKSQNVASFTYHSYDVTTHNIFEPLSSIPGDDSVFDSSALFHSRGHSSPVNTRQQPVMRSIASSRATTASTYSDRPLPLQKTNLCVAVVNCQGVHGKKADLENMWEYMDPNVLILTETELDPSISPAEFLPAHYKGDVHKDVKSGTGGVMLAYNLITVEVPYTDAQSGENSSYREASRLSFSLVHTTAHPVIVCQTLSTNLGSNWKAWTPTFQSFLEEISTWETLTGRTTQLHQEVTGRPSTKHW